MKKLFYFLMILPLFSLTGCEDDDNTPTDPIDQLPPATQTGANTFGCLVNGEPYVVTNSYNLVAMYQQEVLFIGGSKVFNNLPAHISILVEDTISQGQTYSLANNTTSKGEYYLEDCFYTTTPTYTGTIEITHFDTVNYIVSGKFEFQAIAENCGDGEIINITNGRFDLQYIP